MLITIQNLLGANLMSLQTGQPLAKLDAAIIDPRTLKILAFYVSGPMVDFAPAVVFASDIREFGPLGAIIDSADKILPLDDLVRLEEVIDFGFVLDGIKVVDDHKNKLGKVANYTLDPENFEIQQLMLTPTFAKAFRVANLTVSRKQVLSIDNQKIVVKAPDVKVRGADFAKGSAPLAPVENPFRKPKSAAETEQK